MLRVSLDSPDNRCDFGILSDLPIAELLEHLFEEEEEEMSGASDAWTVTGTFSVRCGPEDEVE